MGSVAGFFIAIVGFFGVFLRTRAKASWTRTLALTGSAAAMMLTMAYLLVLDFPGGLQQPYFDLPWR